MAEKVSFNNLPTLDEDVECSKGGKSMKPSFRQRLKSISLRPMSMIRREVPPIDDSYPDESNNSDTQRRDELLSIKICKEHIKQCLSSSIAVFRGKVNIITQMESDGFNTIIFQSLTNHERNQIFLWSAFIDNLHFMKMLYSLGVDISYAIGDYTALHLGAFSGNLEAVKWLLSLGCDINYIEEIYTPLHCAVLGNSLPVVECLVKKGCLIHETILNTAVLSNSADCVQYLLTCGAKTDHYDEYGMTSLHIAADRGLYQVLKYLTDYSKNLNGKTSRQQTALHLSADGGYTACVELLLEKGANRNEVNDREQTALHLAARGESTKCLEALLKGGCDPNAEDRDKRTPLHSALNKDPNASKMAEILIKWGANVNARDISGYCPLHVAALNELSQCVDLLIMKGANVAIRSKGGITALGMIVRKIPTSVEAIKKKLNDSLSFKNTSRGNREIILKMDFRYILQDSNNVETAFLQSLVKEGCKEILEHPLCMAFLHLKWKKVRWAIFVRLFICSLFVLLLSLYVITSQECYHSVKEKVTNDSMCLACNSSSDSNQKQNRTCTLGKTMLNFPNFMLTSRIILLLISLSDGIRLILSIPSYLSATKKSSLKLSTITQIASFIIFLITLLLFTGVNNEIKPHLGAFIVLCGWVSLMILVGSLPYFGTYISMFHKVQKEFTKLLSAYCCLLIGFSISFSTMFPENYSFNNILKAFVKTLGMMTGELNVDELLFKSESAGRASVGSYLLFTLFLFFVTIILMNLLVGIAVHDIEGLHHTAGLSKLVRETESIYYLEAALFQGYLPNKITNILKPILLMCPKAYRVVIHVRPMNPLENQVPRDVMMEALKLARQRKLDRENANDPTEDDKKHEIRKLNKEVLEIKKMMEEMLKIVKKEESTNL